MELKYLSQAGVTKLWAKVKNHVGTSISALSSVYAAKSHTHTKSGITDLKNVEDSSKNDGGLMSSEQSSKLAGIAANANNYTLPTASKTTLGGVKTTSTITTVGSMKPVPIIDGVPYYQDNDFQCTSESYHYNPETSASAKLEASSVGKPNGFVKAILRDTKGHITGIECEDVTVPTKVSSLTNDSGYQTAAQVSSLIDSKLTSAVVPKGSIAIYTGTTKNLDAASASNLGWMYNITTAFEVSNGQYVKSKAANGTPTVDSTLKFNAPDGQYPAGTNIYCVNTSDGYKWDIMAGFVDLSGYVESSSLLALTDAEIDTICS